MAQSVDELRKVVISRATEEAKKIIEEAEKEAKRIVEEAVERKRRMVEDLKKSILSDVRYEQRLAEAKVSAKNIVVNTKARILDELREAISRYLDSLDSNMRFSSLRNLVDEAIQNLDMSKSGKRIVLKVSNSDLSYAEIIAKELARRYHLNVSIEVSNISGGVIVEDLDENIVIDNSYDSRIKRVLTLYAPELEKRLLKYEPGSQ